MHASAIEAMVPWLHGSGANPSGAHRAARAARRAIDDARDQIAAVVGAHPSEVVFTSGGTEADNLAIFGAVDARAAVVAGADSVVTAWCSSIEHPAVLEAVSRVRATLTRRATPTSGDAGPWLSVSPDGRLDLDAANARLADAARRGDELAVVSLMTVNNEVGVIQPVVEFAAQVRAHLPTTLVHTDAIQALTWLDLREVWAAVDLLSLSGHKFGGPAGVGALIVRRGSPVTDRQIGGGQEAGRRAGTPSVAAIVAMGVAAHEADRNRSATVTRVTRLRDRLADGLQAQIPDLIEPGVVDGNRSGRVAGNAHVCMPGVDSEALLFLLDDAGIAASAASSCASGAHQGSHVLAAMGVDASATRGALRLTLGSTTTQAEVDGALTVVIAAVQRLRRQRTAQPSDAIGARS